MGISLWACFTSLKAWIHKNTCSRQYNSEGRSSTCVCTNGNKILGSVISGQRLAGKDVVLERHTAVSGHIHADASWSLACPACSMRLYGCCAKSPESHIFF